MKQYKLWNIICGWVVFAIAAFTYLSTMEPTASFWDCPEFITTAFKLEVGHPPGAPFFMLMGHFFSLFASDVTQVAAMVNAMSALSSAFTILFLFWTITLLAKKIVFRSEEDYTLNKIIAVLASGAVGALAFTFTDSFWFSAVEGEVYAFSSLFTAVVFWAILKWDECYDQPFANRWLVFIAYLMGLSIGVHLLNLLAIPAIVLVYYFRKKEATFKGTILALLLSFAILGTLMYGLIPGIMKVASWFELLFVNSFGLKFNTGFIFYLILLSIILIWGLYETYSPKSTTRTKIAFILGISLMGIPFIAGKIWLGIILIITLTAILFYKKDIRNQLLNTILLIVTAIGIGYSSYAIIVIRSTANPPMDQNSPENVFTLQSYLNREQYGDRPLFYGPYYNAEVKRRVEGNNCIAEYKETDNIWSAKEKIDSTEKDAYIISDKKREYIYDEKFCTILPRMYSPNQNHVSAYKEWGSIKGKTVRYNSCGQEQTAVVPTFGENLQFFLGYQVMYMYMRYFGWNFIGRQNDIQGYGEIEHGMCITGFPFIDSIFEGDSDLIPTKLKNNKGRNVYYALPFLLGLLGLVYQYRRGKKGKEALWLTGILFFMTGLAIVLYLNQTPYQPRERDYAYAGSFYAYAIWIGFGVLGLCALLKKAFKKVIKNKTVIATVATILSLLIPVQMASENWDDHDRSNRYTCRDFGYNYLISCAPNSIIFTNGDNDTFPLWYLQEVEGVRRDVRVCNLSYLQTDWYIDQMRRQSYESAPLPITWKRYQYVQGTRDVAVAQNGFDSIDAKNAIQNFLLDDNFKMKNGYGIIPSKKLVLPINKAEYARNNSFVKDTTELLSSLTINLDTYLYKHELMILEMLSQNEWKRPIYFAVTVGSDYYMGLDNNFQLEGLAYRIIPMQKEEGTINTDIMYDNMMNKFRWGGIDNPNIYLDENNLRMCRTFRLMFYRLTEALINEGKNDKALKALDYCMKVIPGTTVPHEYTSVYLADEYYHLNQPEKGDKILNEIATDCLENIRWYTSFRNPKIKASVRSNISHNLAIIESILNISIRYNRDAITAKCEPIYKQFVNN